MTEVDAARHSCKQNRRDLLKKVGELLVTASAFTPHMHTTAFNPHMHTKETTYQAWCLVKIPLVCPLGHIFTNLPNICHKAFWIWRPINQKHPIDRRDQQSLKNEGCDRRLSLTAGWFIFETLGHLTP